VGAARGALQRETFIDNLLVRIHLMRWTGLAPWEFEFPFPGSLTSTFLRQVGVQGKQKGARMGGAHVHVHPKP